MRSDPGSPVLDDLRVVVTRSGAGGPKDSLTRLLREAGVIPLSIPLTRTELPRDPALLERAALELSSYDWLVATSVRAVPPLVQAIRRVGGSIPGARARGLRICAVGPRTGKALTRYGLAPDILPARFHAEGVVRSILSASEGTSLRVLFPRAEEGREVIPQMLRGAGADVQVVAAYRTVPVPGAAAGLAALVSKGGVDALTFTAPSGARLFVEAWVAHRRARPSVERPDRLGIPEGIGVLALGPTTADALRVCGLSVDRVAKPYTFEGLLGALADWASAST